MQIIINGKTVDIGGQMSVSELLAGQKVRMPDMVSVELNGKILDRKSFETIRVSEGDKVEFLYFMGGGGNRDAQSAWGEAQRAWRRGQGAGDIKDQNT